MLLILQPQTERRLMVRSTLLVLTFLLWSQIGSAQDNSWKDLDPNEWVVVATDTSGSVWKLRRSDIANETNLNPQVWVTIDHSRDKTVQYRQSKRLIVFDCAGWRSKSISVIRYRADGAVVSSFDPSYPQYSYIVPDTVIEGAAQNACPTPK